MMKKYQKFNTALMACALACIWSPQALAQAAWPNKPIRLIVPYSPGGFTDLVARLVAKNVGDRLGQPVTVDNKPGANSIIGVDQVAKAAPDGYTFGFVIAAYAVNTSLYAKLPYNAAKDIQAVSLVGKSPLIAAVGAEAPYKTMKELIDQARKTPGQITFGSSGNGSATHLSLMQLQSQTKTRLVHVPYKGNTPALTDLLGGRLNFMFTTPDAFLSMSKAGKIRMIGVASDQRMPVIPDVPTFKELGFGDYSASTWAGVIAPAGISMSIANKLADEVAAVLKMPEVKAKLDDIGFVTVGSSPDEFTKFIAKETAQWGEVIRVNKISAED